MRNFVVPRSWVAKPVPHKIWSHAGIVAIILSATALTVQIALVMKRKSACSISTFYVVGMLIVGILWLLYGVGNKLLINTISSSINLVLLVYFFFLKIYYDSRLNCSAIADTS